MQFLFPGFLVALLSLSIPIIIHLFYFRRFKRVNFTNVRFLKEIKEETSARSKLRNLLVLLARLFALGLLVLGFSQPFIAKKNASIQQGNRAVSVFVDNSFSMGALSQEAPLLEKAKQRAEEIVRAFAVTDVFQVITNDFEGRHQRLVSKEDALALIQEIKPSPASRKLSQVLQRQQQTLLTGNTDRQEAFVISDFQKSIADLPSFKDTTLSVSLVPLRSVKPANLSIDSAWFEAPVPMPNQTNLLMVKVSNHSDQKVEQAALSLEYEGQTKPAGTLEIPARSSVTDSVLISVLHTGWHQATLTLTDYPVQFDDKLFLAFEVPKEVKLLQIAEASPNPYIQAAVNSLPNFSVQQQNAGSIAYAQFPDYQLIILDEVINLSSGLAFELKKYVESGGNLVVFPSAQANLAQYQSFLQSIPAGRLEGPEKGEFSVTDINTDEFIFRDVYENKTRNLKLPNTRHRYKIGSAGAQESLLLFRDGRSFLSKFKAGSGHVYLCASALNKEYSNLAQSGEVFIPMLYKMAISATQNKKVYYTLGQDDFAEAPRDGSVGEAAYRLTGKQGDIIPEQRVVGNKIFVGINQLPEAGYYTMNTKSDSLQTAFGINYNRRESDLQALSAAELSEQAGDRFQVIETAESASITGLVQEESQGTSLWRWCLIGVLAFLLIESLLLRFWKA